MTTDARIRYTPGVGSRLAPPSTSWGDQKRNEFLHDLEHILGDPRLIWLPNPTNVNPSVDTDASRHAAAISHNENVVTSRRTRLGTGSGYQVEFDGTDDEADTPDNDRFSFGDGAVDLPFSVVALINPDVNNAAMSILAKENSGTAQEWRLDLTASGHPQLQLTDESASAVLNRRDATAIGTSDVLLAARLRIGWRALRTG